MAKAGSYANSYLRAYAAEPGTPNYARQKSIYWVDFGSLRTRERIFTLNHAVKIINGYFRFRHQALLLFYMPDSSNYRSIISLIQVPGREPRHILVHSELPQAIL